MDKTQLLGEIESVIRRMPDAKTLYGSSDEALMWAGEAQACMHQWNPVQAALFIAAFNGLGALHSADASLRKIRTMLYRAQTELRMETVGPVSAAVNQGAVFHYFDEVRKLIESATSDLLVVDPYLDAEFVATYMGLVKKGVVVRLLTQKCLPALIPAAKLAGQQYGFTIQVRSSTGMHDRYLFIDGGRAFFSGASFKDGAKNAPTVLNEIVDAFPALKSTYEDKWAKGAPH